MGRKSKSTSRSVEPVHDRHGRVIGFRKMVSVVTKTGKRARLPRFLPRSQWPKSESALARMGVDESFDQIVDNNKKNLLRGRAKRGSSKTRRSSSSKKTRRSSSKRRSSRSRSPLVGLPKDERAFRRHFAHPAEKKIGTIRASQMYAVPESKDIPVPPPRPAAHVSRKSRRSARKSRRKSRRSSRKSRRAARRSSTRGARKARRSSTRGARKARRSASKSRRSARKSARKTRRSSTRGARKARRSSRSARRSSRKSSRHSSMGASVVSGASARKGRRSASKSWSRQKNVAMARLMRKEYGKVLTPAEFKALPSKVRRELQLQAYESAFPEKKRRSPTRFLSNKGASERASVKAKKDARKGKKSTSSTKKRSGKRAPAPEGADGQYPGKTQAIQDFISAYSKKSYKSDAARAAAMTRDMSSSKRVLKRSTSYNKWKAAPWDYDMGGIDTKGAHKMRKGGSRTTSMPEETQLYKKLYPWWRKISQGSLYVIYNDGTHETFPKLTDSQWIALGEDKRVKKILTSSMSSDALERFVETILRNHKDLAIQIERTTSAKALHDLLMENEDKLFKTKLQIRTRKDYHV